MQIPGGMTFYLPEVKWQARQGSSFNTICNELRVVILASPEKATRNNWPTDMPSIEDWVDLYNATVCQKMGWTKYVTEAGAVGSVPKTSAPQHQANLESLKRVAGAVKELVQGARTLGEWVDSKEAPVSRDLAAARAKTCVACPQNSQGDLTKWFTVPAAELIRRHVEKAQERSLTTPLDNQLGICSACHCPMKLKVHIPLEWVRKRLTPEEIARLKEGTNCWILNES